MPYVLTPTKDLSGSLKTTARRMGPTATEAMNHWYPLRVTNLVCAGATVMSALPVTVRSLPGKPCSRMHSKPVHPAADGCGPHRCGCDPLLSTFIRPHGASSPLLAPTTPPFLPTPVNPGHSASIATCVHCDCKSLELMARGGFVTTASASMQHFFK